MMKIVSNILYESKKNNTINIYDQTNFLPTTFLGSFYELQDLLLSFVSYLIKKTSTLQ